MEILIGITTNYYLPLSYSINKFKFEDNNNEFYVLSSKYYLNSIGYHNPSLYFNSLKNTELYLLKKLNEIIQKSNSIILEFSKDIETLNNQKLKNLINSFKKIGEK